jgi:hypothetical protein
MFARGRKSFGHGLCRPAKRGASRSELLVARKHAPDSWASRRALSILGDLGAALLAEPALAALVALAVAGCFKACIVAPISARWADRLLTDGSWFVSGACTGF